MLAYHVRIAWKSLKRNPVLSALLVGGIALGIGVSTAFVTTYYVLGQDPIPSKSSRLFHVQMDAWSPSGPFKDNTPEEPPDQLTYQDAVTITQSDIPTFKIATFKAELNVRSLDPTKRPLRADVRLCSGDFFRMFEVPFAYGGPWDEAADRNAESVVVLDHETNLRLFGGGNSVGETLLVDGLSFTVAGVLQPWRPRIKFYDVSGSDFGAPESLYIPFNLVRPMEIQTAGNSSSWNSYPGNAFADLLASEVVWVQAWVQLDDSAQKEAYQGFLDAYATEQRALGRFERPLNNRLRDVNEWLAVSEVMPDEAKAMLVIALLFLVVCSVNLIGILMGKFLARAPEVGVRRALGASRGSVFVQHLIECELIGLLGGALGLGLSVGTLELINSWMGTIEGGFTLDANMVGAGVLLSVAAGLIAGLYPSWRICRVAPAAYLKQQ